jgi:hypothetical protein
VRRPDLTADCEHCAALCCTILCFDKSEAFAIDKPAGVTCPHVTDDARCGIYADRVKLEFSGCMSYDCYGAGQRITALYASTRDVRERDQAFHALRDLNELLWQLTEAAKLCPSTEAELARDLALETTTLDALAERSPAALIDQNLHRHARRVGVLLRRVGAALGDRSRIHLPIAR